VFTTQFIPRGSFIMEFHGNPLSFAEAVEMGDAQCYALQTGLDREYILLNEPGKYLNHSCDPNAGLRGLRLVAVRDIAPGEELCFDYSTTMAEDYWELPCSCGSVHCRGSVRDFKHLPSGVQRKYRELGIVAPFIP
jgi:hypothetical protein